MIYFENLSQDPAFNQALEETIFEKKLEEDVLLLWRNRPAVVCGRYQNIFAEVDIRLAEEKNVSVIRRISGGGTVYHDPGNINYTFIKRSDSTEVSYEPFLKPVMAALNEMGVMSEIILSSGIAVSGKKISGSAQRKVKNRVLHHGTLLFDCDLNALRSLANGARDHYVSRGTPSTPWPVTNLKDLILGEAPKSETFMAMLLVEFKKQFDLKEGALSREELRKADQLAETKYRNWDWTFGKNPAFSFSRGLSISGQIMDLSYSSRNGMIEEFHLIPEVPEVSAALEGQMLKTATIKHALAEVPLFQELGQFIL